MKRKLTFTQFETRCQDIAAKYESKSICIRLSLEKMREAREWS